MHARVRRSDHVDIKAPCHLMLIKACSAAPSAVLAAAGEKLVPPLEATLTTKVKSDAVKQEVRCEARCALVGWLAISID
jgi:cullin-associated NEDD8-dissociated protein 1